jgi:hypothetical protein
MGQHGNFMTQTFDTNSDNDIFIGEDGRLAVATGLRAVLKGCESATYAQLGEMVLAQGLGIPNFQSIWIGVPNYQIFELYLRRTLLAVDGVTSVKSLQITVKGNTLSYTATIVTIYGTETIVGDVPQGA